MEEIHFGNAAKASTARVLEIFLSHPDQAFYSLQLAEMLGWASDTGTGTINIIIKRLYEARWFDQGQPVRRARRGKLTRTYYLNEYGVCQAQLLVDEVWAREAVTAQIMQFLIARADNWPVMREIAHVAQLGAQAVSNRVGILSDHGWILTDTSRGSMHYRYTFNPNRYGEIMAFIAMVAAR